MEISERTETMGPSLVSLMMHDSSYINRRQFLMASAAAATLLSTLSVSAREISQTESLVINLFELMPDLPGVDGFTFPVTTGIIRSLQRSVWPENPDMYWDPEDEDYRAIFGFSRHWTQLYASQADASLRRMSVEAYDREVTRQTLESNGWELVDDELGLLHYAGSEDDRAAVIGSLHILGSWMRDGEWDWVALPDDATVVIGSDGDRVSMIADRVLNDTPISTIGDRVHELRHVLRSDSYFISVLPPERLPLEDVDVSFISRSWTGDLPIIHSVGLQMGSGEQVQQMIETVQTRLETETSAMLNSPYSEFLEIVEIAEHGPTVRFDFVDASGEWDVFRALDTDDLQMFPLIHNSR